MKKFSLLFIILPFAINLCLAQSIFPTDGSNAGIGTTSPNFRLHINNSGVNSYMQFTSATTGTTSSDGLIIGSGDVGQAVILNRENTFTTFLNNSTEYMRLAANGNLGIGNTNPGALLSVGSTSTRGTVAIYGGTDVPAISLTDVRPSTPYSYTFYNGVSGSGNLDIFDQNAVAYRFSITSSGNVGIGTTTPDTKLAVNGTIHAKEVKVDLTGWPDYVFKPKYNLPSLTSLKTYIDQNQHLPDMPSEAEVEKNGINLGEIVKLQTKKIEELTLYLIEKEKQLAEQNKKLDGQQTINHSLQKQINQLAKRLKK